MTHEQYLKNLSVPTGCVDAILDTDAYNEIDDQFAIAYLLRAKDKVNTLGFCAAPFLNERSVSPEDGMEKSHQEIMKLLRLARREDMVPHVYRGSCRYLPDEKTPVESPAARYIVKEALAHTPENPLYVVAIGAITNVASALLMEPAIKENIVIVWLGGHGHHLARNDEFNLVQDIAAARVIFGCGAPVVQLPCNGVVTHFAASRYELEHWLLGKSDLCTYLVENTIEAAESYAAGKPWTRIIWDVTAVAWLLDRENRFMDSDLRPSPIPEYDNRYAFDQGRHLIRYVNRVYRDDLFADLFEKLTSETL